jgi:hypothetical protein
MASSLRTNAVDLNGVTTPPPHVNMLMYICQCYGILYQVNQEVIAESTYKSLTNIFFCFSLTLTNDRYGMKSATIFQNRNNNMYTNHN